MTGQDQELREALGRYIEGVQRNAEELLDVLQKASPSQRGAVQPTKNNAQVATSPVPLSSSTPVPNTKEISQSTPIELRSSEGLLLAMVEHYPGGKIVVVPKVELPADNSTYSRFLKPRILTPLAVKYPQFRYRPIVSKAIVVGLELQATQEQWSELVKPLSWTFEKAERQGRGADQ